MQSTFDNIISLYCNKNDKLGIAVSGGMDSMSLLYLCINSKAINKNNIMIINVDHNIRKDTSKRDSDFVKNYCLDNSVKFLGYSDNVLERVEISKKSIELEARDLRREIFFELKKSKKIDKIMLAHHSDDNAESILMHIFRGSGINGLKGMQILTDDFLLRPLLEFSRSDIEAFVKQKNIPYVTDESNNENIYTRNFIRNEIMPKINTRFSGASQNINILAKDAVDTDNFILDNIDNNLISTDINNLNKDNVILDLKAFDNTFLAHKYIFLALQRLDVKTNISRVNILEVIKLSTLSNNKKLELPCNIVVIKRIKDLIFIKSIIDKSQKPVFEKIINVHEEVVSDNNVSFDFLSSFYKIKRLDKNTDTATLFDTTDNNYNKKNGDNLILTRQLYFDSNKIKNHAVIRTRENGDVFKPFGSGTKKLKDYLIDKKIPLQERDKLLLMCCNNNVLAILGVEISDSIKIDNNTKKEDIIEVTKWIK